VYFTRVDLCASPQAGLRNPSPWARTPAGYVSFAASFSHLALRNFSVFHKGCCVPLIVLVLTHFPLNRPAAQEAHCDRCGETGERGPAGRPSTPVCACSCSRTAATTSAMSGGRCSVGLSDVRLVLWDITCSTHIKICTRVTQCTRTYACITATQTVHGSPKKARPPMHIRIHTMTAS
jgi:hypothetical protein